VVFDFEKTSGLFFLANFQSNSIGIEPMKVVFYFKITLVCSFLANFSSNSIGIGPIKSGFRFHVNFRFARFGQLLILFDSNRANEQWFFTS
jgi:hypothetical protein